MQGAFRRRRNFGILTAFFFFAARSLFATEANVGTATLPPRETGVLLLPALDATKEATNMQAPRQLVIRHRQQFELLTRQFKLLGETLAQQVAKASPAIDLSGVSARTPESLDLLARRAGADWVVHTVVENVDADTDATGLFLIKSRLRLQIWDVRRQDWLVNQTYTGQASGGGSPVFLFMRSLDSAARNAFATILAAYPRVVAVENEESVVDYLAGQTKPVVGEPEKPFRAPQTQ